MSKKKKSKATGGADKPLKQAEVEPDVRQGVLVVPMTAEEAGQPQSTDIFASLTSIKVPVELFNQQDWVESPLSRALGYPLRAARWPGANARLANKFAQGLFLCPNPTDDNFGRVKFKRVDGPVLVATLNGEPADQKAVETLLLYLSAVAKDITEVVRTEKEARKAREAPLQTVVQQEGQAAEKEEGEDQTDVQVAKKMRELEMDAPVAKDVQSEKAIGGQMDGPDERAVIDDEEAEAEWAAKREDLAKRVLSEAAFRDFAKGYAVKTP